MSILLDALRKSEERRQLGKVPDIHSSAPGDPPGGLSPRRWIALVLVAVSAIAMAWVGWQQFRQPEPRAPVVNEAASVAAEQDSAPVRAAREAPAQALIGEPDSGLPRARRTPVETLPEGPDGGAGEAVDRPASLQQSKPRKSPVNESFTAFEATRQAEDIQQQVPDAAATGSTEAADQRLAPGKQAAAEQRAARVEPRTTDPISFWELPHGIRDNLPDLRITVLVYAEVPRDRFVLVGGQRLVEKDEFQDGVVLEEIRRDGAVFLYRNYRFLVKG